MTVRILKGVKSCLNESTLLTWYLIELLQMGI